MKYFVLSSILCTAVLLAATPVSAQINNCNQRCEVDSDCGNMYRCYVGVCRLDACPAASTCSCTAGTTVTPVPTMTPRPTASPKATAAATIKPMPTASVSANLSHTPKTGFESWMLAGGALALFAAGAALPSTSSILRSRGLSPREILELRQSSQV